MPPEDRLFLRRQRAPTAGAATGAVLELGVRTGLNQAGELIGIDPDAHKLERLGAGG